MITDWRGTEIRVGSLVFYPASDGTEMVEGIVRLLGDSVAQIEIVRRSCFHAWSHSALVTRVQIRNLTVVDGIADSSEATWPERVALENFRTEYYDTMGEYLSTEEALLLQQLYLEQS